MFEKFEIGWLLMNWIIMQALTMLFHEFNWKQKILLPLVVIAFLALLIIAIKLITGE